MFNYNSISNDDFIKCAKRLSKHINLQELINIIEHHQKSTYPVNKTIDTNRALDWLSNACFGHSWNFVSSELKTTQSATVKPSSQEDEGCLLNVSGDEDLTFSVKASEINVLRKKLDELIKLDLTTPEGIRLDETDFLIGANMVMTHLFGKKTGQVPSFVFRLMSPTAIMQDDIYYLVLEEAGDECATHTLCAVMNSTQMDDWCKKNEDLEDDSYVNYEIYTKRRCKLEFAWNVKINEPCMLYKNNVRNQLIQL